MKTTIETKSSRNAIKFVAGIVPNRSSLPVLEQIRVTANGHLDLEATDLTVTLRAACPTRTERDGEALLPKSALVNASTGKGEVEIDAGETVSIRAGGAVRTVPNFPIAEFPPCQQATPDCRAVEFPAGAFMAALKATAFAQSTDETRYVLNGVFVEIGTDAVKLVATDGRRLHLATLPGGQLDPATAAKIEDARHNLNMAESKIAAAKLALKDAETAFPPVFNPVMVSGREVYEKSPAPETIAAQDATSLALKAVESATAALASLTDGNSILLPAIAVKHILRIPLDKKEPGTLRLSSWIVETKGADDKIERSPWARVDCGAFSVITKQIEGDFPNYRQVIPTDCLHRVIAPAAELAATIAAAAVACTEKANSVKLHFTRHSLTISAGTDATGIANAQMAVDYTPPDGRPELAIAFNPRYLIDVCEAFKSAGNLALEFTDELCPVKIVTEDGHGAVVMPMRLS